jgi:hypothetical protein
MDGRGARPHTVGRTIGPKENEWGPGACTDLARALGQTHPSSSRNLQQELGRSESGQRASSITDSM